MSQTLLQLNERVLETHSGRREIAKTLLGFCLVYLPHYFFLEPAEFHKELFDEIENPANRFLEIIGFRGSAKSTIGSLALPLWGALEYSNYYPFIIPIADTSLQSGLNIANIKTELDNNSLLRQDYGKIESKKVFDKSPEDPTFESDEEWQAKNMLLSNGVRILGRSRGQKVRGIRHKQHRPKLIVVDDPEDLKWVKTKENRDATERWLRGEVLPGMDERTGRCILIGNHLHNDGLLARMKKPPTPFKTLEYPLMKNEKCTWLAKYPNQKALDTQRQIAGPTAWMREYLLKVVAEEGQIIKDEWIQYYDNIPEPVYAEDPLTKQQELISNPIVSAGVGVDLAISKKESADFTAMVGGVNAKDEEQRIHLHILPRPINRRLNFQETIATAKGQYKTIGDRYSLPIFFVEDVAYQRVAIEMMQAAGVPAHSVKVGTDKRTRLLLAAPYIENGTVLFPKEGCEDLLAQLTGFGIEDHDDLADSFVHLVLGIVGGAGFEPMQVIKIL